VSEREDVVYSDEVEFSDFACMHKTKWLELYDLLQRSGQKDLLKHIPFVKNTEPAEN
jgi:hypothetical protein